MMLDFMEAFPDTTEEIARPSATTGEVLEKMGMPYAASYFRKRVRSRGRYCV